MEGNQALIITVSFIAIILLLLFFSRKSKIFIPTNIKVKYLKQLDNIKLSTIMGDASANRDAIVRLDALLSELLQYIYNNNAKCGVNIKRLSKSIAKKKYDELWEVHLMRNRIVRENIEISPEYTAFAYRVYSGIIFYLLK